MDRDGNGVRNSDVPESSPFPLRSVEVGSIKAAFNRIVSARATNPQNVKCKLVCHQQNGDSQSTFISDKLVKELGMEPID